MVSARLKKILIWLLKIIIFVVAWSYVVYKLATMEQDFSVIFSDGNFSIPLFSFVCILMFANWGAESLKWQNLVNCGQKISYRKAVSGVLVGLPLALITPNRVGEIGGRAIVLDKGRKNAVVATFLGSMTQLASTLIFGVLGVMVYLLFFPHTVGVESAAWISLLIVVALVVVLLACRDQRWLRRLSLKLVGRKMYVAFIRAMRLYCFGDILRVLIISLLRYCVFSMQFGLLIRMLIPELSVVEIFVGITLTYLFTTVIPTTVLGEIGIRGSVAMFVFGAFTTHVAVIFQISLLIWIINIAVPTLAGSLILLSLRQKKHVNSTK